MGKFVYIYYNAPGAEVEGGMEAWGKWFQALSAKLVDAGNPFGDGAQAVHAGGVMPVDSRPATGYSIVTADSMADAVAMAKDCPLTTAKEGAIVVYEALPM